MCSPTRPPDPFESPLPRGGKDSKRLADTCSVFLSLVNSSAYGHWKVDVDIPSTSLTEAGTADNIYYRDMYFVRTRPQYEDIDVSNIINVKTLGAKGDGKTDDTTVIANALSMATANNLIYFPAGSYIITSTLQLLDNTRKSRFTFVYMHKIFYIGFPSPLPVLSLLSWPLEQIGLRLRFHTIRAATFLSLPPFFFPFAP